MGVKVRICFSLPSIPSRKGRGCVFDFDAKAIISIVIELYLNSYMLLFKKGVYQMDEYIRAAQKQILKVFAIYSRSFALAGGTALELYYLHHSYSKDLGFFSARYDVKEIEDLVLEFGRSIESRTTLENEFTMPNHARVRFYTVPVKGAGYPLKINFVEDVLIDDPKIVKIEGTPVYDVEHSYSQKIFAITGTHLGSTSTGGQSITGRRAMRDIVDMYFLSNQIRPLHQFLRGLSPDQKRGMVLWYRSYPRMELRLGLSDLDLYGATLDGSKVISYLDHEIKLFMKEELL